MKVLGFDPGVSKSGWAIICSENGLVDYGFQSFKSSKDGFNDKINEEMKSAIPFFEDKISGVDAVAWEIVPSFGRMNQRERVLSIASVVKVVTFQKKRSGLAGHPPQSRSWFVEMVALKRLKFARRLKVFIRNYWS